MIKKFQDTIIKRQKAHLKDGTPLNVEFSTLAVGEKGMITAMYYKKGTVVPKHSHKEEQLGYVASGLLKVQFGDEEETEIGAKDSYAIAGGVSHTLEALEDSVIIDIFIPIRDEYLD